jgi:hypothetical protein
VTTTFTGPVKKFSRRGKSKFLLLPAVASDTLIPTRAELTAGVDFTSAIATVDGWSLANQPIDTPDMSDDFDSQIPGSDKADSSSFTLYEDEIDADLEALFAKGTEAFVVILRKGDVPASASMDIFHIQVGSQAPAYTTDNDAAKLTVMCTILERPVQGAAVPAAAT